MATNKISGRITHHESGIGIPNLVVEIFDVDPKTFNPDLESIYVTPGRPLKDETFEGGTEVDTRKTLKQELTADRLGSVITDSNGYFELIFEDEAFMVRKKLKLAPTVAAASTQPADRAASQPAPAIQDEIRPDLFLVVTAPEETGVEIFKNVIYRSNWARVNAGREETYMIRLTTRELEAAKIPVPVTEEESNNTNIKIAKFIANKNSLKAFRKGVKEYNTAVEEEDKEERKSLRRKFKEAILPNLAVLNSMRYFVKDTDTIEAVQSLAIQDGIDNVDRVLNKTNTKKRDATIPEPGKGIKVNLFLTEEEKADLDNFKFTYEGKDYYNIPENLIQQLLFKRENDDGINTILFSNNPISKACISKSREDICALEHIGEDTPTDDGEPTEEPDDDTGGTGISKEDIPLYLEKLLFNKDADPFQDNGQNLTKRHDAASVQKNVDNFALQKGPADATAFYDFHSLQIAFQYVWHQLLDETLVNLSENIHISQENAGRSGFLTAVNNLSQNDVAPSAQMVAAEAENEQTQTTNEVPTEISSAFDISFLEYDALSNDDKDKLKSIAKDINDTESGLIEECPDDDSVGLKKFGKNFIKKRLIEDGTYVSVLRDQGERIIDNVRVNKPFSTNEMLKELQERLLSKYEFTVFAANKDYHSINFGLMNTYRQKWEPVSYQAGQLVKTIPMSPKEERKYSVKTVRKVNNTIKEARKNNSSLQSESTSTSRAETEIMGKAYAKSNFNLSVSVDTTYVDSTLSFGKEASKESSEARKGFREAVLKATQEYKEERSIQIDTEQTFDSEYTESGTIVNPNDELSVTYLFYELQRRYRVSEQLYRVMPVVMVARKHSANPTP